MPPPLLLLLPLLLTQTPTPDAGAPTHAGHDAGTPAHTHRMGVHGMVLFGTGGRLYASHIPMFRRPHDRQLLLEVELKGPRPKGGYASGTFTLEPERFDLDLLESGQLRGFRATVYRGNFEGGGKVLSRDVEVAVRRVLLARPLKADDTQLPELRYWLLGEGAHAFLVHTLSAAPDFDQVLHVTAPKGMAAADGVPVLVRVPGRENVVTRRLTEGEHVEAMRQDGTPVRLTVRRELSNLVGPHFGP